MGKITFTYIPKGKFTCFCNVTTDITFYKITLLLLNFSLYYYLFCIKGPLVKNNYINITFFFHNITYIRHTFAILWT
jgi:hypothetical protein